jgi:oligopeptide/dipeptide ABC transporter ATP-binding protein
VPNPDPDHQTQEFILMGDVPSPVNIPGGCRFHTRCPLAERVCREKEPEYRHLTPDHAAACHLVT